MFNDNLPTGISLVWPLHKTWHLTAFNNCDKVITSKTCFSFFRKIKGGKKNAWASSSSLKIFLLLIYKRDVRNVWNSRPVGQICPAIVFYLAHLWACKDTYTHINYDLVSKKSWFNKHLWKMWQHNVFNFCQNLLLVFDFRRIRFCPFEVQNLEVYGSCNFMSKC